MYKSKWMLYYQSAFQSDSFIQWYITQIDPINNSEKIDCEKMMMMMLMAMMMMMLMKMRGRRTSRRQIKISSSFNIKVWRDYFNHRNHAAQHCFEQLQLSHNLIVGTHSKTNGFHYIAFHCTLFVWERLFVYLNGWPVFILTIKKRANQLVANFNQQLQLNFKSV